MKDAKGHGSNPRGTHASGVENLGRPATSVKQVIKAVGSDKLDLVRGNGYWYFIYDDPVRGIYDTTSIPTMQLRNFTIEEWAADGREFVAKMEKRYAEKLARRG